jgi:hypothetical protein
MELFDLWWSRWQNVHFFVCLFVCLFIFFNYYGFYKVFEFWWLNNSVLFPNVEPKNCRISATLNTDAQCTSTLTSKLFYKELRWSCKSANIVYGLECLRVGICRWEKGKLHDTNMVWGHGSGIINNVGIVYQ